MLPPVRHWRSYGNDLLPMPTEAMAEPFDAFPSWFLRSECDRCDKVQMVNTSRAGSARWCASCGATPIRKRESTSTYGR